MTRYFTPFNFFLVILAIVAGYAVWVTYENRALRQNMNEAAPGHVLEARAPQSETIDIIMFYDYNCPHCLRADPIIHQAIEEYGRANLIYKFVAYFGDRSMRTAKLAYAGGQQDAFLRVHGYIISHPETQFEEADIQEMATEIDLDYAQLIRDMNSRGAENTIRENMQITRSLNMMATPAFLINNRPFIPFKDMPDVEGFIGMFEQARAGKPLM